MILILVFLSTLSARGGTSRALLPVPSPPGGAIARDGSAEARRLFRTMGDAAAQVRDYTMTLHKQEWDTDSLGPEETLVSKWARPCSVYLKRLSPPHAGREVLYVPGWNSDRLRVSLGTFPNFRLNLDAYGKLAMSGSRHPITETSLIALVDLILRNLHEADAHNESAVRLLADDVVAGHLCRHLQLTGPAGGTTWEIGPHETLWDVARRSGQSMSPILQANRDQGWEAPGDAAPGSKVFVPRYYATRIELWIDPALNLPLKALIYDQAGVLFESFEHRDLKINVGLSAWDFSTSNPEYRF